jgi:asparagine synthase (glutamine-hydrolysing)
MCGITGFWREGGLDRQSPTVLQAMTDCIAHRGPDADGHWMDRDRGVALGHRRLSILDLSAAGAQPMASPSQRYTVVYNGEIYNFAELRRELEAEGAAPTWRGHSDTEVLVASFDRWGIPETLRRANGMFAIAVWDAHAGRLTLARDRLGEKPLYYGRHGDTVLFGSELKALTQHPAFRREVDRDALAAYLRFGYVPAPRSIWQGIAKLPPACLVEIEASGTVIGGAQRYWHFDQIAADGSAWAESGHDSLALEPLLLDAVKLRMVSDVPLGAFLSGGIDSSLVVALMQAQSSAPVRTFTIGFDDPRFNEAEHAKAVARHLGTDHTEQYVASRDALDIVPELPVIWDEPFGDSSQIPTLLVSRLAARSVTVALSGDGGDELFGGYHRYVAGGRIARLAGGIPSFARGLLADGLSSAAGRRAAELVNRQLPGRYRQMGLSDRMIKAGAAIRDPDADAMYRRFVSYSDAPNAMLLAGEEDPWQPLGEVTLSDPRAQMMVRDTVTYLPDDILTKVDRASMATSIEARVPLLDPRIVEAAWRLPMNVKIAGGVGKQPLREILYRYVPRELIERPKNGFAIPVAAWLAGPLREWAEALLHPARLAAEGFFRPDVVTALWRDCLAGVDGAHNRIWTILMFQAWLEHESEASREPAPVAAYG